MWCSRKLNNEKEKILDMITYFEGTCEFCLGNMGIEQYLREIEKIKENLDEFDDETKMLVYFLYALVQYKIGKLQEAFLSWKEAEKLAEKIKQEEYLAKIYSYLAIIYYVRKENNLVTIYFSQASAIFNRLHLYADLALHYINILWYKRTEEDKTEVISYLEKALYYVKCSNSKIDARIYLHIGYILNTVFHDYMHGISFLKISSDMCYRNGNMEMECMTLHTIADGYMQLKHFQEAIHIYEDIHQKEYYDKITKNLRCMVLTNEAICYIYLGKAEHVRKSIAELKQQALYVDYAMQQQVACVENYIEAIYFLYIEKEVDQAIEAMKQFESACTFFETGLYIDGLEIKMLLLLQEMYLIQDKEAEEEQVIQQIEQTFDSLSKADKIVFYQNQAVYMNKKNQKEKQQQYLQEIEKEEKQINQVAIFEQLSHLYQSIAI